MKSTTYIDEITTQKNEKYLSEGRNPLVCLPACLLASCQLRNFLCEFTEKCFAIFLPIKLHDLSDMILVALLFQGIFLYHSFYGMTSRFQSNQGEGVHSYVQHHLLTFSRSIFFHLNAKYPIFQVFLVLPPVKLSNLGSDLSINNIV